jgi:hypothetical protein
MKFHRRRILHLVVGAAALPAVSRIASAQTYPSRPITIVVGLAAGGSTDVIARMMAERMKSSLGQPVIVENVTGAGGTIAAGRVARAAPDGYTLSLGNVGSHVLPGATYALQYDLLNDFEPVALLSTGPYVLSARKTMPANDLKGLIAWLKANPDKATLGIGNPDIAGFTFKQKRARGFSSCLILGELLHASRTWWQVRSTWRSPIRLSPCPRCEPVRSRPMGSPQKPGRHQRLTFQRWTRRDCLGSTSQQWHGLWLPKGTPKNIIARLNAAVIAALADPMMRARLATCAGDFSACPTDTRGPRSVPEGRNREVVAHHQGREHQEGVTRAEIP